MRSVFISTAFPLMSSLGVRITALPLYTSGVTAVSGSQSQFKFDKWGKLSLVLILLFLAWVVSSHHLLSILPFNSSSW